MITLDLTNRTNGSAPVELKGLNLSDLAECSRELRDRDSCHVQCQGSGVDIIGMFGPENKVPDVERYSVIVRDGVCDVRKHSECHIEPTKNKHNDLQPNRGQYERTILLLLESPHKEEYNNNDPRCPIAPAQGATGTNIDKFLGCSLNRSEMANEIGANARVIIANPVQFQTSLCAIHKKKLKGDCWTGKLRDAVWKTLWNERQIRDDFCCRLRAYNPNILLNCCTENLRDHVTTSLSEFGLNALIYKAGHPSSWYGQRGVTFNLVDQTNEGCRDPDVGCKDG